MLHKYNLKKAFIIIWCLKESTLIESSYQPQDKNFIKNNSLLNLYANSNGQNIVKLYIIACVATLKMFKK